MTELTHIAARLQSAVSYLDVFGTCKGDTAAQRTHIKNTYRTLTRAVHPDKFTDETDKANAQAAFVLLGSFRDQAEVAVSTGTYGTAVPLATITTKKHTYRIVRKSGADAVCDWFTGDYDRAHALVGLKVARRPAANVLVANEAKTLRLLCGVDTDVVYHPYLPELVESFGYRSGSINRSTNAFVPVAGLINLSDVRTAFGGALSPLDMAWMWRRLLVALGYVHSNNVLHGAIVPSHIYVQPADHGLVVDSWYSAVVKDGSDYPAIGTVPVAYKHWYPQEVLAKQHPTPGTDIAMAAKTMVWLVGGDPVTGQCPASVPLPLCAFFKGCMQKNQHVRPQSAWHLLLEFDELLERMGAPYYPRRFRPLVFP